MTTTTVENNHALSNCRGQLESIKELYREFKKQEGLEAFVVGSHVANWTSEGIREQAQEEALSVEFRSGWCSNFEDSEPEEFKILLSTGGPACQVKGNLDQYKQPTDIEIQYQDWGTPWTTLYVRGDMYDALEWFCNCFYFGE